jgi:SAM-dependent methyltransferase
VAFPGYSQGSKRKRKFKSLPQAPQNPKAKGVSYMIGRLIPRRLKASFRDEFAWLVKSTLPKAAPLHLGFLPHQPESPYYFIPKNPEKGEYHDTSPFPVPPVELRQGYGDRYLSTGKDNIQTMRGIIAQAGSSIESLDRILDFACGAGRMIRWLADEARSCEIWGTDIDSTRIVWCKQYLSPPLHFATTTVNPHLPFEDRYFGLVYAGSIFTHIDDLADAWFQELRRILRPGGRLYITISDGNTIALINGRDRETPFAKAMHACPVFEEWSKADFGMFTIDRFVNSQVFYNAEFLAKQLESSFRLLSVTKEAYGYQSAMLLERI